MTWYHLLVFIHVVAAVIWVGGILFIGFVAVPSARRLPPETRGALLDQIGRRFRSLGYIMLAVLIATGVWQAGVRGATLANVLDGSFFATRFGALLGIKVLLIVIMIAVSSIHDFVVGPASARLLATKRDSTRLRKQAAWLARITAVLALLVLWYGIRMVR